MLASTVPTGLSVASLTQVAYATGPAEQLLLAQEPAAAGRDDAVAAGDAAAPHTAVEQSKEPDPLSNRPGLELLAIAGSGTAAMGSSGSFEDDSGFMTPESSGSSEDDSALFVNPLRAGAQRKAAEKASAQDQVLLLHEHEDTHTDQRPTKRAALQNDQRAPTVPANSTRVAASSVGGDQVLQGSLDGAGIRDDELYQRKLAQALEESKRTAAAANGPGELPAPGHVARHINPAAARELLSCLRRGDISPERLNDLYALVFDLTRHFDTTSAKPSTTVPAQPRVGQGSAQCPSEKKRGLKLLRGRDGSLKVAPAMEPAQAASESSAPAARAQSRLSIAASPVQGPTPQQRPNGRNLELERADTTQMAAQALQAPQLPFADAQHARELDRHRG